MSAFGIYIKPSVDISPELHLGQLWTLGLDIGADIGLLTYMRYTN